MQHLTQFVYDICWTSGGLTHPGAGPRAGLLCCKMYKSSTNAGRRKAMAKQSMFPAPYIHCTSACLPFLKPLLRCAGMWYLLCSWAPHGTRA